MPRWYSCAIVLDLPIEIDGDKHYYTVATYPNDPGLQVGEHIIVHDATPIKTYRDNKPVRDNNVPRFDFSGLVTRKEKLILVDHQLEDEVFDAFEIRIYIELADKEDTPRIRQIIKDFEKRARGQ